MSLNISSIDKEFIFSNCNDFRNWAMNEKIYFTYLTIKRSENIKLDSMELEYLEVFNRRENYYSQHIIKLKSIININDGNIIKSLEMSRKYPKSVSRYSADVDILIHSERDYLKSIEYFHEYGFVEECVWIRKNYQHDYNSSVCLVKPDPYFPGKLLKFEIHLNGFPITEFTDLYPYHLNELSSDERLIVWMMANLSNRCDENRQLTLRDRIDIEALFCSIREISAPLVRALNDLSLWMTVFVLLDKWRSNSQIEIPSLLQCLASYYEGHIRVKYDLYSDHAVPYLESLGVQNPSQMINFRLELDKLTSYSDKYFDRKKAIEHLDKGIPIAAKVKTYLFDENLLDCFHLSLVKPPYRVNLSNS